MRKIITLLAAMALCVNLVACGGVDTQPAIDAYNELSSNYNTFVELANEEIDSIDQDDIDYLNALSAEMNEYATMLESDTEFTQEEVDEMVEMFNELNDIIVETLDSWGE